MIQGRVQGKGQGRDQGKVQGRNQGQGELLSCHQVQLIFLKTFVTRHMMVQIN